MTSANPEASILPPVPTPHWGDQSSSFGAFTVRASNVIHAPAREIISTLLQTDDWPQWNRFVPSADISSATVEALGRLHPGVEFTEHVDMSGKGKASRVQKMWMKSEEEVVPTEENRSKGKGYRVVWVGKQFPDWALRSERVHEVWETETEDGSPRCIYDDYETMSGPLAILVRIFVGGNLVERFSQWNQELGSFVVTQVNKA